MKVSYHGHSVVQINTQGKNIIIDPFITGNTLTDLRAEDVKVDVIILSHGHNDHVGDTVELAKRNDALVVATDELSTFLSWQGVKTHGMHIGGSYQFEFGRIKLTQAFHGSSYATNDNQIIYCGMPAGILFMSEGKTIYHAGDTALFSDMKLIGERHPIDLAFLPIGDNYTMGPEDAAYAAELLRAKTVVPIHYNTFPPIKQDPNQFIEMLSNKNGLVLAPGEAIEI
ncbi:metal-dependent hydrolase [Bacillus sp. AFS076308]|uniref:metal-dependent hydrolase n=1 Tax=unclassified Bacillus (in: firmicutes) TaxID=185979 RepID=UPI000BF76DD0|nr:MULTISPECIES: metal-dependent hydrolase [unclassified Bacillus (in: firmicutes)]PFN79535.1 metal-dependent hydrolase [Bacillus sp. AFS076308]PGV48949.1 metal-dependent hydrolase [Bacillus sp. AFS037270]